MKQSWMLVSAAVLAFGATAGWADEKPAGQERTPPPRPAPSALEKAPPPKPVPPAAQPPSTDQAASLALPAAAESHPALTAPCAACAGHERITCQRLWEWATYRPLSRPGICGCQHRCAPCCEPPLYAFFLDTCRGGSRAVVPPPAAQVALLTWDEPDHVGSGSAGKRHLLGRWHYSGWRKDTFPSPAIAPNLPEPPAPVPAEARAAANKPKASGDSSSGMLIWDQPQEPAPPAPVPAEPPAKPSKPKASSDSSSGMLLWDQPFAPAAAPGPGLSR